MGLLGESVEVFSEIYAEVNLNCYTFSGDFMEGFQMHDEILFYR